MIFTDVGVHDVITFCPMLFRKCASEFFAINDYLLFSECVKEFSAILNQASLYLVRIYGTHQSLESVRRGTAVRTVRKETEITCSIVGELTHAHIVFAATDIGQQSDCQKVGECISATSCNSMIRYCHKDFIKHDFSAYSVDIQL